MENLKNKLILLRNLPYLQANEYYVSILVNVVIGYLLQKNLDIYVSRNSKQIDGIIFFNNVVISLRHSLFKVSVYDYQTFEYYIKVFLGEEVATNLYLDYEIMECLGELYPSQHVNLSASSYPGSDTLSIYEACLAGIDPFSKQYISNLNVRTEKLFQWLDTVTFDLSTQPLEWQKLYEASVRSINEQPLAPYYVTFTGSFWLKLTKDQYFKVLAIYLYNYVFRKKVDFCVQLLNLEIISLVDIEETQHESFALIFPQIFIPSFLEEWNIVNDFEPDLSLDIRRVYVSKLWVKCYYFLKMHTLFFQDFVEVQRLEYNENAMLTYLKSLSNNFFLQFLTKFLEYLEPFEKK